MKQAFQTKRTQTSHGDSAQLLRAPCSYSFRGLFLRTLLTVITAGSDFLAAAVPIKGPIKRYSIALNMETSDGSVRKLGGLQSYSSLAGTALKPNLMSV